MKNSSRLLSFATGLGLAIAATSFSAQSASAQESIRVPEQFSVLVGSPKFIEVMKQIRSETQHENFFYYDYEMQVQQVTIGRRGQVAWIYTLTIPVEKLYGDYADRTGVIVARVRHASREGYSVLSAIYIKD